MRGCLFCLLLASLLVSAESAGAQQVKLKASLQFPVANPFGRNLVRFKDEVGRQTGNAVVIEIVDKAQLLFGKGKGFKFHDLTPDQIADWRACSAGMLTDYMEKNGKGARKLMDAYGRLRQDPCCSAVPGEGTFTRH